MKKDQNKRLLGAMEFIDDKLIDRAAEKIKERPVGAPAEKPSKKKAFRQLALLAACLLLLGAAVPLAVRLVNYIPNMLNPGGIDETTESNILDTNETEPPEVDAVPEEYFTNGWLYYLSSDFEYEGKWIHVTKLPGTEVQAIASYDPVTNTTSSICLNSACNHVTADCPACMGGWDFRYMNIMDDWCVYQIDGERKYSTEVRMYNMKTGEYRVIFEDTENGNVITYASITFVMDGKVYLGIWDIDDTSNTRRNYISYYDPETDKIEHLLDVPENLSMINLSNKRIFFIESRKSLREPATVWSSDHSGGNLKKEEVANFDFVLLSGTYAYEPVFEDNYGKNGYNLRVYDLATDSMHEVDLGAPVQSFILAEGKLYYVPEDSGKLYLSDALGKNPELVVEFDSATFHPYYVLGDYIICGVRNQDGGTAINIKTGEINPIPGISYP